MPTSTLANVALNLKISILKVKFIVGTSKFIKYNHTICDINFASTKPKNSKFYISNPCCRIAADLQLKFKIHSGLVALKSYIEFNFATNNKDI